MARATNQQLQERITALQAENDALHSQLDAAATSSDGPTVSSSAPRRTRGWGWTLLATVLIVIGAILAPVAVVANWAKAELSDTDTFVATFAPLAKDPSVQAFVTDQVVVAIDQQVDITSLTSDVFDGIVSLGLSDRAATALKALEGPTAEGIKGLMRNIVSGFVTSKSFATVWEQALRTSHQQLIAAMQNDKDAVIALGQNGEIGIQLGPIIAQVKSVLVKHGVTFATSIPTIDKTIVIAQSDAIGPIQTLYQLTIAVGAWLQWVALAFLIAGTLVARRRSLALVWAAVGLGLGMTVLAVALAIGRTVVVANLSPSVMPAKTATELYDQVVEFIQSAAVAVAVLAIAVAVIGWMAGPFRIPRRLRAVAASGAASLRAVGERHRLTTGKVGEWLYRQRVLVRVVIAAAGAVIVVFTRPLTPGLIVWTAVICIVVVGILELVQRPGQEPPAPQVRAADGFSGGR
jgi:hypothetical protein